MITEKDLQEAIAECEGQRNPTVSTCIKLAAFYTIREQMFGTGGVVTPVYSTAPPPTDTTITYTGDSEFAKSVNGMDFNDMLAVMDEAMSAIYVLNPKLYNSIIRKLNNPH